MDWWNILIFGVIPVLSVLLVFIVKRKILWIAPLISTVFSIVVSMIAVPSLLSNNEHSAMFWGISIPIHLVIVVILTAIAYLVAYILKRKQK